MKRSQRGIAILLVLLVIGLLLGSIIGDILNKVGVPYINDTKELRWSPAGNLVIIKWDFDLLIKINLASVLGLIAAFWIFRRL